MSEKANYLNKLNLFNQTMINLIFYILIGIASGFLAGLLGIGGGIISIPGLALAFTYTDIPKEAIMHVAASTGLAAVMFTAIIAVITQHRNQTIQWELFRQLVPGIIVGTILGALIANTLSTETLRIVFGLFMLVIAIRMLATKQKATQQLKPLGRITQHLMGFMIGGASGVLGIGGGAIAVPAFMRLGLSPHHAAGTSSACVLLLSIVGTLSFIFTGWNTTGLPAGSTGYVYWPAVLAIALASIIFVPLGTKLARRLSGQTLKRIFAGFLLVVGVQMLIG